MNHLRVMVSRLRWSRILIALLAVIAASVAWVSPTYAENFDRQNLRMVDLSNQDLRGNNYTVLIWLRQI
jgi:hypothetical protein